MKLLNHSVLLTQHEKDQLRLSWLKKMVKRSDLLEREFLRTIE
jgi:hypothetical protein